MTDDLQKLVRNARELMQDGYYDQCDLLRCGSAPSLREAIRSHPSFPLIAEAKQASPLHGRVAVHPQSDLIRLYREGGAAGISVVTEPRFFGGDIVSLGEAVRSGLPTLMKDFIVDERQIKIAARLGASAVLLIDEAFTERFGEHERESLVDFAHELDLEVLLETGNDQNLDRVTRSEADIIGLNQRDLGSMTVDPDKGLRLLRQLKYEYRPVVVMSGIISRSQVESLRDAGASAVLIGSAVSSSTDPIAFLRSLEVER